MKTEEALAEFLVAHKLAEKGDGRNDWYAGAWFHTSMFGVQVPFFPRLGFRHALPAHDTHHMLNEYSTGWVGECETAAWELASGGCGLDPVYWIDRLLFGVLSGVIAPIRSARAWRRGWRQRNLYGVDPDELLEMDLAEVRRYVAS
jgi:hypothetical protein